MHGVKYGLVVKHPECCRSRPSIAEALKAFQKFEDSFPSLPGNTVGRSLYPYDILVKINGVRVDGLTLQLAERLMVENDEPLVIFKVGIYI